MSAAAAPAPMDPRTQADSVSVASILDNVDLAAASKSLSPVGQLGSGVEYIFTNDVPFTGASGGFVPSRGWTDDLCYGTGTAYLSGLMAGGAWGFLQGLRTPLEIRSTKLRINAVLNGMTRRGPFVGNSVGMLAMMYNGLNSAISSQVEPQHKPVASVAAAAAAGALFKSTAGLRPMAITSLACGSLAVAWQATKQIREDLPIIGAITTRTFH